MKKILITGAAGFIGFHLTKALLKEGFSIVGIDNLNDYYDPTLKDKRLKNITNFNKINNLDEYYSFYKIDICNEKELKNIFQEHNFDFIIHLAAQAGVRYSIENPKVYVDSNLTGFVNILEECRHSNIKHFIFASSSSVYGMNKNQPFSTSDNTDYPISLYAATKKSNEILAHSYSHLYGIPTTGLRFFTVYGPYGRPDMAYYSFTKAIHNNKPIKLFNSGKMKRDFTYIDDIVKGISSLINKIPERMHNHVTNAEAAYRIINIGNNKPITLNRFIRAIENSLNQKAIINLLPMQAGDVPITYADIEPLNKLSGFQPSTSIEDGIDNFVNWYLEEYKNSEK